VCRRPEVCADAARCVPRVRGAGRTRVQARRGRQVRVSAATRGAAT
jgi:hypothetical protein